MRGAMDCIFPPLYERSARFALQDEAYTINSLEDVRANLLPRVISPEQERAYILRPQNLEKLARDHKLALYAEYNREAKPMKSGTRTVYALQDWLAPDAVYSLPLDGQITEKLRRNIDVFLKEGNIIEIRVRSTSPKLAGFLLNSLQTDYTAQREDNTQRTLLSEAENTAKITFSPYYKLIGMCVVIALCLGIILAGILPVPKQEMRV